jgi:hypothetical protein
LRLLRSSQVDNAGSQESVDLDAATYSDEEEEKKDEDSPSPSATIDPAAAIAAFKER